MSNALELRSAKTGAVLSSVPAGTARTGKIAYAPNGLILGSCLPQGEPAQTRNAWSIKNGKLVAETKAFENRVAGKDDNLTTNAIAISRDGKYGAFTLPWRQWQLWDLEKRAAVEATPTSYCGSIRDIYDFEFSFDGKYVAAGSADGTARVWEVTTGRQLLILDADVGYVSDVALQPNGQLITANSDGMVHVWDVPKHLAR